MYLDIFTVLDIISYCDIDTKSVMKQVCKRFGCVVTMFDKMET